MADRQISAREAVQGYHDDLARAGLSPDRTLAEDVRVTAPVLRFDAAEAGV